MTRVLGRDDRRRRILSEARLSESADETTQPEGHGHAPRYSPPAESASFAMTNRLLPTGAGALAATVAGVLLLAGGLGAAGHFQAEIAVAATPALAGRVDPAQPTSLQSLATTVLGLAVAGLCGVVFGLRRRRSDDLRGVYRWWAVAAAASLLLVVSMATGLHGLLGAIIAEQVGWSPLAGGAFWWLVPSAVVLGGLAIRVFFDLKESGLAAAAAVVSATACGTALASGVGFALPIEVAEPVVTTAATHLALGFAAVSLLAYSRRIGLEASGVLAAPAKRHAVSEPDEATDQPTPKPAGKRSRKPATPATADSVAAPKPRAATTRKAAARLTRSKAPEQPAAVPAAAPKETNKETQWVDGSQGDMDDYSDDATPRKLSKAERKRLRRQKARQQRAA